MRYATVRGRQTRSKFDLGTVRARSPGARPSIARSVWQLRGVIIPCSASEDTPWLRLGVRQLEQVLHQCAAQLSRAMSDGQWLRAPRSTPRLGQKETRPSIRSESVGAHRLALRQQKLLGSAPANRMAPVCLQ